MTSESPLKNEPLRGSADLAELRDRAIAATTDGIIITDATREENPIIYVNPGFKKITGLDDEDVLGRSLRSLKDDGMEEAFTALEEAVLQKRGCRLAVKSRNARGEVMWLQWSMSPVFDKAGNLSNYVIVQHDITDRKELEHLKDEFVSTVSHELRTPLAIIKEGIALLLDKVTGEINPQQKLILETSKDNVDRLARIINNLLDTAAIESGRVQLDRRLVDMREAAQKVILIFTRRAEEKNLKLESDFPKTPVSVYVDEDKVVQVFTNLIANAIKFTAEGTITVSVKDGDEEVRCEVTDTGVGMSAQELDRLFNKFQQFGRKHGPGDRGTGLGLSIAKGFVEMHDGRIWAESEPGHGTKFIFTIRKYKMVPL